MPRHQHKGALSATGARQGRRPCFRGEQAQGHHPLPDGQALWPARRLEAHLTWARIHRQLLALLRATGAGRSLRLRKRTIPKRQHGPVPAIYMRDRAWRHAEFGVLERSRRARLCPDAKQLWPGMASFRRPVLLHSGGSSRGRRFQGCVPHCWRQCSHGGGPVCSERRRYTSQHDCPLRHDRAFGPIQTRNRQDGVPIRRGSDASRRVVRTSLFRVRLCCSRGSVCLGNQIG
mmetsp:Transcript_7637/g.23841  ORF Transcript_7637/g.23841 Transcript_7637/m.23841 type:complete len:232 (-) Transcript_7637:1120-1815(-)